MKIAVFIDSSLQTEPTLNSESIAIFERSPAGQWQQKSQVAWGALNMEDTLAETRRKLTQAVTSLGNCKVAVLHDLRGIIPALLEDQGYRVWKATGSLEERLDQAETLERQARLDEENKDKNLPKPEAIGEPGSGVYRFDLMAAMALDDCPLSYDILLPFFETVSFTRLELLCDHLPRWFAHELEELGLVVRAQEQSKVGEPMQVVIGPRIGERSAPPGRRPKKAGCCCG